MRKFGKWNVIAIEGLKICPYTRASILRVKWMHILLLLLLHNVICFPDQNWPD